MKSIKLLLCTILTVAICFGTVSAVYANDPDQKLANGYWWSGTPRNVFFNCDLPTSEREAVRDAMQEWNSVKTPSGGSMVNMFLTTGSTNSKITKDNTWSSWVGYCNIYATSADEISSVHIELNDNHNWSVGGDSGTFDIQTVTQHELGHALGVAHCHEYGTSAPCWSATCYDNVMNREVSTGVVNTNFQPYDEASYINIYW